MKRTLFMLMLIVSTTTVLISCKKDDEKNEKERVSELLVSGKWYYQSHKEVGSSSASTCWDSSTYWEFKADGTYNETTEIRGGTYTLSENGKNLTIKATSALNAEIKNINSTSFTFVITATDGKGYEFVLGKPALNCKGK